MEEFADFTISGNTIDRLKELVNKEIAEGELTTQSMIEFINLSGGLNCEGGMNITFHFDYNS